MRSQQAEIAALSQANQQQQECIAAHTVMTDVLTAQLARNSAEKAAIQGELSRTRQKLDSTEAAYNTLSDKVSGSQLQTGMTAMADQQSQQVLSPPSTPSAVLPAAPSFAASTSSTVQQRSKQKPAHSSSTRKHKTTRGAANKKTNPRWRC